MFSPTAGIPAPVGGESAFVFPGTPADHPAAVDGTVSAQESTTSFLNEKNRHEGNTGKAEEHRRHRPHLHLHPHRYLEPPSLSLRPASRHPVPNSTANGNGINNDKSSGSFLTVPKTYAPHARSLDSPTRSNGEDSGQEPSSASPSPPVSPSPSGDPVNALPTAAADPSPNPYESPSTPTHAEPSGIPAVLSQTNDHATRGGPETSVWEEIKTERGTHPGINPSTIHARLATLQSLTRGHTLKLSTLTRTIEHRMAEWAVLGDKMDEVARSADALGKELVGARTWEAKKVALDNGASPGRGTGIGEPLELDTHHGDNGDDSSTPSQTLRTLVRNTSRAGETLESLKGTIAARSADISRFRNTISVDSVKLERRMGKSLARKMHAIEAAERDAKQRDLIINVITFTLLLIGGIFLSRLLVKISTCRWRTWLVQVWSWAASGGFFSGMASAVAGEGP